MEERENQQTCTICGKQVGRSEFGLEEHESLMCGICVDTWEREVDSFW